MQSLQKLLKNPRLILATFLCRFGGWIPDKIFIRLMYYTRFGKLPNLRNPITFNEKLQWLKINDRKPEYTVMVDKIKVKDWVANKIGSKYIIPTLAVYNRAEDIDPAELPDKFVLKCNHDSGGICICADKSGIDIEEVRKRLNKTLKRNFYRIGREWPYKDVDKRILAEEYMVDESGYELKDYKIFCFNGIPEFIQVDFDRFAKSGHKRNLYNVDWNLLDFEYGYPSDCTHLIKKPETLTEMLQLASTLAKGRVFLRVDFYTINGVIKFGEITFFPECGLGQFNPPELDKFYGQKLNIAAI